MSYILHNIKVPKLKSICEELGRKKTSNLNKNELIECIERKIIYYRDTKPIIPDLSGCKLLDHELCEYFTTMIERVINVVRFQSFVSVNNVSFFLEDLFTSELMNFNSFSSKFYEKHSKAISLFEILETNELCFLCNNLFIDFKYLYYKLAQMNNKTIVYFICWLETAVDIIINKMHDVSALIDISLKKLKSNGIDFNIDYLEELENKRISKYKYNCKKGDLSFIFI